LREDYPGMLQTKTLLELGKLMDASCTSLHILMVTITAELTLVLVVPTKKNSPISASMIFTLESNSVVKQDHKFLALLETAKVSVWSGKE
jgi:hypothetical protein